MIASLFAKKQKLPSNASSCVVFLQIFPDRLDGFSFIVYVAPVSIARCTKYMQIRNYQQCYINNRFDIHQCRKWAYLSCNKSAHAWRKWACSNCHKSAHACIIFVSCIFAHSAVHSGLQPIFVRTVIYRPLQFMKRVCEQLLKQYNGVIWLFKSCRR